MKNTEVNRGFMSTIMKPIGVVAKYGHPEAGRLTAELLTWLDNRGLPLLIDDETATHLGLDIDTSLRIPREHITTKCSPVVVMGGDGTLINVCRHPAPSSPIIIGVNLGTLGFLTEITTQEMIPLLEEVLAGRSPLEERRLLTTQVNKPGRSPLSFTAINDIVISKGALARIFPIDVFVDEQFAAQLRGDGVIVSTPSGSTAYSLAAGGSIVHPQVDALLLTPICPHSLTSRPLVLPGTSKISLRAENLSNVGATVNLTVDGQEGTELRDGDEVIVSTSRRHSVMMAKSPSKNFYEILGTKLNWAASSVANRR